jgi:carboxypeptidase Taq
LYKAHLQEIGKLNSTLALLHWDQRTYLPPKGQEARAEVIGKLTKMVFELSIDDRLGRYLDKLEKRDDLSEEERASVRVVGKEYRRRKAIPPDFYERFAIASSKAESVWERAKAKSDFSLFRPHLEEMVEFARRFAEYYGYEESPYDALIEDYEPGMTSRELRAVIEPLRAELVPFIERLKEKGTPPETDFLRGTWPSEGQRTLSLRALRAIGYDFDAGRLDPTVHPFTISTGPNDVRVTTRFIEGDLLSGLFSSLHEGGHALYDQGIDNKLRWSGLDEGASYGIHESQSRMWENLVGRSRPFWTFFKPILAEVFPAFADLSADAIYRAANVVEPSLIRVEADEVTYNLHIMLRFELEEGLITGKIAVRDLPELWRDAMDRYLGIVPEDDAHGVLQDVHWSSGLFGYFPSYMLGNLYSAQIFATAKEEIPNLDERFAEGDFAPLLTWLREKVHRFGKIYEPKDLVKRITGEEPDSSHFVGYITDKYSEIYKL